MKNGFGINHEANMYNSSFLVVGEIQISWTNFRQYRNPFTFFGLLVGVSWQRHAEVTIDNLTPPRTIHPGLSAPAPKIGAVMIIIYQAVKLARKILDLRHPKVSVYLVWKSGVRSF